MLIPASLVFTHFVSFSSSCLRARKELVAFVVRCRLSLAVRQLFLAYLKVNRRIITSCCLGVLSAPDSDSTSVSSF